MKRHRTEKEIARYTSRVEERKRPRGRPKGIPRKPPEDRYVGWMFRMPKELLARFHRAVPALRRSEFARKALERALDEKEGAE